MKMKKKISSSLILPLAVCFLPMILSAVLYPQLPDLIPSHFDFAGNINGYMPKQVAAFALPAVFAVGTGLVYFVLGADPKKENSSAAMRTFAVWIMPILSLTIVPMTLFISLGKQFPIGRFIPALVGVILAFCGNYLPKNRQNYTVGIKLPWTLSDEDNWNKTHRLAGYLWMAGGAVITVGSLLGIINTVVVLIVVFVLTFIPAAYSYMLYKQSRV